MPKFGSEGTVVPYRAVAPSFQMSDRGRVCVPVRWMGEQEFHSAEAGRKDDEIMLVVGAVLHLDARGGDASDGLSLAMQASSRSHRC